MTRKILLAASLWAASILGARVIGLVREAVLGRMLGAGSETDAYWSAFLVPDFLNYLLAGGALSIVFIPIFAAYLARGEEARAWESFSAIVNVLCLGMTLCVAAAWVALPRLAPLVAPGFDAEGRARLVELSRIVLLAQPFHVVGGLLAAALQARDRHALPALAPVVYNLGIVVGGLIGGRTHGAEGFAWGVVAGSALGPFGLPFVGCLASGLRWSPRLAPRHPDLRAYLLRSLPIMLGLSIVIVDDWFLRREGSRLGAGAVSVLAYAKSLMRVPVGVVGLAAGAAVYPTLVRLAGQGQREELKRTLLTTLRALLLLSFLAQAAFLAAGPEIVTVVYGRGRIDPERAHAIAQALGVVTLGLAAWSAQALFARCFYAFGKTWPPMLLGTLVAACAYPAYVWLGAHRGTNGLALASTLAIVTYAVTLAALLERTHLRLTAAEARELALFAARSLLVLALSAAAALGLRRLGPEPAAFLPALLRGTWLALGVGSVFCAAAWAAGLGEMRLVASAFRRRLGLRG